jgi:hypothetical protein
MQSNISRWLDGVGDWSKELAWSITEPGKQVKAQTAFGTYIIAVRADDSSTYGGSYELRFASGSGAGDRVCPTRFTAINRVAGEAEDHYRRLQAQQKKPTRMKPPVW